MTTSERNRAIGEQLLAAHAQLRAELDKVRRQLKPAMDRELLTHCLMFCENLRSHHTREEGVFTVFETEYLELAPVLAELRQEHHVVAATLTELASLLERSDVEPAELRAELEQLAARLEAHFAYEEEKLLPVLNR